MSLPSSAPITADPPTPQPVASVHPKPRALWLDAMQWAAMVDIVSLHVDPTRSRMLLGFGLPLFLISTILFSARQSKPRPVSEVAVRRFDRLMMPWLFWCLVYAAILMVFAARESQPIFSRFEWPMLLYGTKVHLWFLPFAFVAGLVAYIVGHRLTKLGTAPRWGLLLTAIVGTLFVAVHYEPRGTPYHQWVFALPSIPLGIALGHLMTGGWLARHGKAIRVVAGLVAVLGGVMVWERELPAAGRYMLAGGLLVIALLQPMRKPPGWWHATHGLLFGVYLSHMAVLVAWQTVAPRLGFHPPHVAMVLLVMAASAVLTWALMRTAVKRFV